MTGRAAAISASESGERAWRAARDMADIQYAPLPPKAPTPPPAWPEALMRFLAKLLEPVGRWLGQGWGVVETALLLLAVIGALWIAASLLLPVWRARRARRAAPEEWTPDRAEAELLLSDADRLAAEGRFDAAAHLLLRRSVDQIAAARPALLSPSSTAREIAALAALPQPARTAFATMAGAVERARYALRPLSAEDWAQARSAYAAFARVGLEGAA